MTARRGIVAVWVAVGLAASQGAGCGDTTTPRRPVHGEVTIESLDRVDGSISFFPSEGHRGPAASTAIVAGQYRFSDQNGPYPGPHRVVVGVNPAEDSAADEPGTREPDDDEERTGKRALIRQRVGRRSRRGPRSNRNQWETAAEVADDGETRHDFDFPVDSS